ncbi:MAG: methylmalonyl-CoA epimerase [Granulosicoccus sp.]|nr:methylmalonyl-CoA epimerase [Granulosicoccus sp.]
MIGRLNHVALVVNDLALACHSWRTMLGATISETQKLPEHGVTVAFIDLPNTRIELLEPLGDGSPVSRFLERHTGGGMHHICLEVEDIAVARDELLDRGARLLGDGEPRIGAHGNPVLFMHPGDFHGTLIELEETGSSDSDERD